MNWTHKELNMYYESTGEGIPVVVLHGYALDHMVMKHCLEPIMDNSKYKKIYVDLPGMGNSNSVAWIKNADDMVRLLLSFIDAVVPSGKFILIGESYGGYLARAIMFKMQSRVAGGVLLCPVILPDQKTRTLPQRTILQKENMEQYATQPQYQEFCEYMVVQTPYTWNRYLTEVDSGLQKGEKEFLERYQSTGYGLSYQIDTLTEPYAFPAMFLLGRQDSIVGYQDALGLVDNFSRGSFLLVDKAGHNLQIEQPKVFSTCIYKFLLDVDEYLKIY